MKRGMVLVLLLVMVALVGCEKKQTVSVTGPSGHKTSITVTK